MYSARAFLCLLSAGIGFAQIAEFGPAPRDEFQPKSSGQRSAAPGLSAANDWYDTTSRAAVIAAYNTDLVPTNSVALGWTGSIAQGVPGTTSTAYRNAVLARLNWFRRMAGVSSLSGFDPVYSAKAQQAALIMASNQTLNHYPPPGYLNYTLDGAEAAGKSNLAYCPFSFNDSGCIAGYIQDPGSNNTTTGHRRWILFPPTQFMGTGDLSGPAPGNSSDVLWNALWVSDVFTPRPATRAAFIAWPPAGYVPYQVVYPRWSFYYPGASFSNSTVTMTKNGSSVPVSIEARVGGSALDSALVWVPENQNPNSSTAPTPITSDVIYNVTVGNVLIGGTAQSFNYQVTVVNPALGGCSFTVSPASHVAIPGGAAITAQLTASASNCAWTASSPVSWAQIFPLSGTGSQTIQLTVFPNFGTQQRAVVLNLAGRNFTITQPGSNGTADERFVQQMYFNFFGRLPQPSEVTFHVTQGLHQGISRWQMAANFLNSAEFNEGGRFVAGAYVGILDRDPEYGGWLFQRNALATNAIDQASLVGNFLASPEYVLKYGSPGNQEFVRTLYRQILGREATQAEVDFQAGALAIGYPRLQMTINFLRSTEFRTGTGPRLTTFLLYATLLMRDGLASEITTRRSQIATGTPVVNIIQEMISSSEFAALLN